MNTKHENFTLLTADSKSLFPSSVMMAELANIEKRSRIKLILPDQPHYDEFLETMSKVFHWLRWLGVAGRERFIWKIWGVLIIFLFIVIECQAIWKVIKAIAGWAADTSGNRSITVRFAGTIFYASTMIDLVICWRLSSSWIDLSKYWASIEVATSIKLPLDASIRKQMHTTISFFVFFSILEHLMSIIAQSDFTCSFEVWLRKYILTSHGFLFLEHQYKDWYTIPLLFMSNLATIVWNLLDLLIILISMGLTSRYRRLNQFVATLIKTKQKKLWSQNIETLKLYSWRKIREEYVKQAKLVREVDSHIGGVILAATFFNFYFICLQLFLGITNGLTGSPMQQIYYIVSFSWVCARTVCSVLAAANVNVVSKSALMYLYQCPPQIYNIEAERLQYQLSEDFVALSGFGLFYLQKTTVLQMAAAVLTYALVLIQYDNSDRNIFDINRNKKIAYINETSI